MISGIVHVLKSGGRWSDAPDIYGQRKTLYNRFVRWAAKGVWRDVFHALASAGGPPAELLIDSTAVKAHRCASRRIRGTVSYFFAEFGGQGNSGIRQTVSYF